MALEHAVSGQIFNLDPLGASLKDATTRSIVKTDSFQAIRLIVRAGERIPEHKVEGAIMLHCLEGAARLETSDGTIALKANDWVYLDGGVLHTVCGDKDSSLLLTIIR